jgi:hypothetical protein
VSSHSADQSSSGTAPAAATAALPGRYADGNGDDLNATPARNSPGRASEPGDVTGNVPGVSGAYIYGYDSAGNPTLTDASYYRSPHGKLPD